MSVPFEETALDALTTDDDIQRRVEDLIGRANFRQLWLLFLDEVDVQLPIVIPIEGLPSAPTDEQAAEVVDGIRAVTDKLAAASVITVLERYGPATLSAGDAAWIRALRSGCANHRVRLRAQLLSHRTGVRWIDETEQRAGLAGQSGDERVVRQ